MTPWILSIKRVGDKCESFIIGPFALSGYFDQDNGVSSANEEVGDVG